MQVRIPQPWLGFLREVDQALKAPVEVHCLGGFVLSVLCDLPRYTGDVDFIMIRPDSPNAELIEIAGEGSEIANRHKLHFHRASSVATYPHDYAERLIDITPKDFKKLRLRAFEVHDIVLAKVVRHSPVDRADFEFLTEKGVLDREVLNERFENELRPYLLNLDENRAVLTMRLWLDEFLSETRGKEGK
jgi:hypothetical protein